MDADQLFYWSVGLYEGEGCCSITRNFKNGTSYKYPILEVGMTDREPLDCFLKAIGIGVVVGPYKNGPGNKLIFKYVVRGKNARQVIDLLYPHLSDKRRKQIRMVLDECEEW